MNISSVQPVSFEWSNDTVTLTNTGCVSGGIIAQDVGTVLGGIGSSYNFNTGAGVGGFGGAGNITISNGGTYTIGAGLTATTISSLTTDQISAMTLQFPVEWQDQFPDWNKVQKMCEEYPGLKIAFEKFQTTYKLVVDHYDTPEDKRPKP